MQKTGAVTPIKSGALNREKRAGDYLLSLENFTAVAADTNVENAAYIFKNVVNLSSLFDTVILVYEQKVPIGIITAYEFINSVIHHPCLGNYYRGWNVTEEWAPPFTGYGFWDVICRDTAQKSVVEIMRPFTEFLKPEDSVLRACYLFMRTRLPVLPVKEKDSIVGLVSASSLWQDVIQFMSRQTK